MKVLGVCASYGLHVAVIDDDKTLFLYSNQDEVKSDNLLSIIEDGLKQSKLKFSDIDVIATCVGPGSFTGSRVAISLVKGLFVGQEKKLVSFESFDCFGTGDVVLSGFGKFVYLKQGENKSCVEIENVKNFSGTTDSESLAKTLGAKKIAFDMVNVICNKVKRREFITIQELMPIYLRASQAEIEREKKNDRR